MVVILHGSHSNVGKSAIIVSLSIASWTLLNLPPSFPTGNKTTGVPFIFLSLDFSGRPILAPIYVPALSRSVTLHTEFMQFKPVLPAQFSNDSNLSKTNLVLWSNVILLFQIAVLNFLLALLKNCIMCFLLLTATILHYIRTEPNAVHFQKNRRNLLVNLRGTKSLEFYF